MQREACKRVLPPWILNASVPVVSVSVSFILHNLLFIYLALYPLLHNDCYIDSKPLQRGHRHYNNKIISIYAWCLFFLVFRSLGPFGLCHSTATCVELAECALWQDEQGKHTSTRFGDNKSFKNICGLGAGINKPYLLQISLHKQAI